jgi:hypothetical protein
MLTTLLNPFATRHGATNALSHEADIAKIQE